jgi:hypothetical protein
MMVPCLFGVVDPRAQNALSLVLPPKLGQAELVLKDRAKFWTAFYNREPGRGGSKSSGESY